MRGLVGGCSVGYHRAGFDVVGIDIKPQPRYPFPFIQADALRPPVDFTAFDAIHASPPCQAYTLMRGLGKVKDNHPDLVEPVRNFLESTGKPWVIENVPGSPLRFPIMLCGSMFGLRLRRHRLFESSFMMLRPTSCEHKPNAFAVYGDHPEDAFIHAGPVAPTSVKRAPTLKAGQEAMGINWMPWKQLTQAIPPAYTEFIGKQLMDAILN